MFHKACPHPPGVASGHDHEQHPAKRTASIGRRRRSVALLGSVSTLLAAMSWIVLSSMTAKDKVAMPTFSTTYTEECNPQIPPPPILLGNDAKCPYSIRLIWSSAVNCGSTGLQVVSTCYTPGVFGAGSITVPIPLNYPILVRAYAYTGSTCGSAVLSWDCTAGPSGSVYCVSYPSPPNSNTFRLNGSQASGGLRICQTSNGC